jgi:UDP-N-acetylglucosamine--N-acetylmuramyl-(pentapeptide) pyrophosphoryl-undecaprenol N-acetylglucosamine transferase
MKILLSGGGTLGPVTPLLAMREAIAAAYPDASFVWVGTRRGPERRLVEAAGIRFYPIASGKLRRYASVSTVTDITRVFAGFFQSLRILWRENPDICITAGGFVSVPVHIAAWLLGITAWVHTQDVKIGLAIKLMAPTASLITAALRENVSRFPKHKTLWLGNPIRAALFAGSRESAIRRFRLNPVLPVVFVTGGGTGSARVNAIVAEAVPHLSGECQIIHLSGTDRNEDASHQAAALFPDYRVYAFFGDEMKDAYAAAAVVVSRAGFGTLGEIAAFGVPAILLPKPGHQEENAKFFAEHRAAVVLDERIATGYHLAAEIKKVLYAPDASQRMAGQLAALLPRADAAAIQDALRRILPDGDN